MIMMELFKNTLNEYGMVKRQKIDFFSHTVEDDKVMSDTLEDIIRDIGVDVFKNVNVVDTLRRNMEDSLYPGCKFFTR